MYFSLGCKIALFNGLMLLTSSLAYATKIEVVTENWPPFNYLDHQKEVVGSVTANIKQILEHAQLTYSINLYPWARSYKLAESKKNHLIYALYKTPERAKHFHWFCPITKPIALYFMKIKDSAPHIENIEQAKHYKIGVVRQDAPNIYLSRYGFIKGKNLYEATNEINNMQKLLNGDVDFIVQSKQSIAYRLAALKLPLDSIQATIALPKDNNDICMALNINSDKEVVDRLTKGFLIYQQKNSHSH